MGRSLPVGVLGAPAAWGRHRAMAPGTMASGLGALYSGNALAPVSYAPWAAALRCEMLGFENVRTCGLLQSVSFQGQVGGLPDFLSGYCQ